MQRTIRWTGLILAICTAVATAQTPVTNNNDGVAGTVPVYTSATTSTLGNSPITVSGGNVGIGTTSPTQALTVNGNILATGGAGFYTRTDDVNNPNRNTVISPLLDYEGMISGNGSAVTPWGLNVVASPWTWGQDPITYHGGFHEFRVAGANTDEKAVMDINGGGIVLLNGSTLIFPDGSVQPTAYTGPQLSTTTIAGGVIASTAALTSQSYIVNPQATGAGPHCFKIATLYASNAGGDDHLHLAVNLNYNWYANANASIDALFGNRGGFTYQYSQRGAAIGPQAKLAAYQNSDTSVDLYLVFNGQYATASYTVLERTEDTVYASPMDLGSATPPGTLIFDASSASYPPSTFTPNGGNVGIGTTTPGAKLEVSGNILLTPGSGASITFPDGTKQGTAWTGMTCGGDYAESVDVSGDRANYEPGDVLVIDPNAPGKILKSVEPYSTLVSGIYSTKPGVVGRRQAGDPKNSTNEIPMAMVGIVPTKVSTENGPIRTGDLLVASATMGHAMKGTDRSRMLGAVIGKAFGNLDSGTGVIEVLVTLQ